MRRRIVITYYLPPFVPVLCPILLSGLCKIYKFIFKNAFFTYKIW